MSGPKSRTRETTGKKGTEQQTELVGRVNSSSPHGDASSNQGTAASLAKVLEEIRDFRQDMNKQMSDIKSELTKVDQKVEEVENRVGDVEDRTQNMEQVVTKLIKEVTQLENKLLDLEGRSRRKNIRMFNVPEDAEGTSMVEFVEKLLRDKLEIPEATAIDIERAHRALVPKPTGEDKPRSIVIRFLRYKTKEEILRKAWGKKKVLMNNKRQIFFDQDYPPAVLQKRKEYSEAKRVLKHNSIRFQTPFPAKLRVHYQNGTQLYQSAEEATTDMKSRGLPINVFRGEPKEDLAAQLSRTAWERVEARGRRVDT